MYRKLTVEEVLTRANEDLKLETALASFNKLKVERAALKEKLRAIEPHYRLAAVTARDAKRIVAAARAYRAGATPSTAPASGNIFDCFKEPDDHE